MYIIDQQLSQQQQRVILRGGKRLAPSTVFEELKRMASTGQLFLEGCKLVCDFFQPKEVSYEVEIAAAHVDVYASIDAYPLVLYGPPHIAIKPPFVWFFHPNVSWQQLEPFLASNPLRMSHEAYMAWREGCGLTALPVCTSRASQPILQLRDHHGLFADMRTEGWGGDLLAAGYAPRNGSYFCPTERLHQALDLLLGCGWEILDQQGRALVRLAAVEPLLTADGKAIALTGTARFGSQEAPLAAVARAIQEGKRFLPVGNGSVALLDRNHPALQPLLNLLEEVEFIGDRAIVRLERHGVIPPEVPRTVTLEQLLTPQEPDLSRFTGTLRPYQLDGVRWLQQLSTHGWGGILADEMGLGKTVQLLAWLASCPPAALIVVPTSLLCNWQREIARFVPHKQLYTHYGPLRNRTELPPADIILTSYGTLRQDIDLLRSRRYHAICLDEAHAIKNSSSDTCKAVMAIDASCRISMTGTPIENHFDELLTQCRFIMPSLADEGERLRQRLKPFLLRRTKAAVALDLPPCIEQTVSVTMEEEQQALYDRTLAQFQQGLLRKNSDPMEVLEAILRLRQLCCDPQLVPQLGTAGSAKRDLVVDEVTTLLAEGKKVLLCSQFATMLQLFVRDAVARDWPFLLLDGSTRDRQDVVDRFQQAEGAQLLLLSLKAGGVGLTLTAADYVLIYDPWWNDAVEAQAIARAHRIGRREPVIAKRYVMANSIEEKMVQLKAHKSELANFLEEDESTIDELRGLLG